MSMHHKCVVLKIRRLSKHGVQKSVHKMSQDSGHVP